MLAWCACMPDLSPVLKNRSNPLCLKFLIIVLVAKVYIFNIQLGDWFVNMLSGCLKRVTFITQLISGKNTTNKHSGSLNVFYCA
ncbi:MAG: hypothetical protein IJ187_04345 [Neisseriaceae bacterium]|nr:hypothetical protein [Neisseriaceae bacterium]